MFENRDRRFDLFSLVLCVVTVCLALSLVSYTPFDTVGTMSYPISTIYQPDVLVYPASDTCQNYCGQAGAFLAEFALSYVGWGAYMIVGTLVVLVCFAFFRRKISSPVARIFGWILSLVGFTTLLSMFNPAGWSGPVIGPGGYLGALGAGLLRLHFAYVGGLILATSVLLAGVLLWTDYLVLQLLAMVGFSTMDRVMAKRKRIRSVRSKNQKSTSGKRSAKQDQDDTRVPIRFGGRKSESLSVDDEYEDEYEEDEDDSAAYDLEDVGHENEEPASKDPEQDRGDFVPAAKKTLRGIIGRAAPKLRSKPAEKTDEREAVIAQLEQASQHDESVDYDLPDLDMLQESEEYCLENQTKEVRRKARILEKTFRDFGFKVRVVEVETGPVIAQYEIELEAGLRLSKITSLADDLAIALRAPSVRIVAPIPGKNTVGIEVPNEERQPVRLREVMEETSRRVEKMQIPLYLGKDVSGNALCADLSTLPHLLIAGRTGTGKSVCLNAIISSILMTRRPDEVRMLMIDPKMVELSGYRTLPHLMHPVVTDMRKAEALLAWAVDKMEERYQLLARAGVRHISSYNQLGEEELMETFQPETDDERVSIPLHLPYIVIVADEMADLMMTAGKEVEQHIIRLAQKSRAVGIHLILATQKPTVDVITGLIKSNLPARICFQVASRTDSRVVLDEMGADKLLGNGDMLFLWPGTSTLLRGQGTYLDDREIKNIVDCVSTGEQNFVNELVQLKVNDPNDPEQSPAARNDALYDSAVDVVIREGRGSVSLLQRNLGIGYGRAARMIDWMAEDGIVGAYAGSQAREVLISMEEWEQMQGLADSSSSAPEVQSDQHVAAPPDEILPLENWREDEDEELPPPVKDRNRKQRKSHKPSGDSSDPDLGNHNLEEEDVEDDEAFEDDYLDEGEAFEDDPLDEDEEWVDDVDDESEDAELQQDDDEDFVLIDDTKLKRVRP